jgi:hypothetical protein
MYRTEFDYPQPIPTHEEIREGFNVFGIPTAGGGAPYPFEMRYGTTPGSALTEASATNSDGKVVLKTPVENTFAAGGVQMAGALMWRADRKDLEQHWLFRLGHASCVAFVGLTDQNSALEMPMDVDSGGTVTAGATNAVGFLFRATALPNWTLHAVRNNVVCPTPRNLGVAAQISTAVHLGLRLSATNGSAKAYLNGERVGAAINAALFQNVALCPVVAFYPIGTAGERQVHLDYYMGRQRKFVLS